MNNSVSTTSANWPTRWPANSFKFLPTLLVIVGSLLLGAVILVIGVLWIQSTAPLTPQNVPIVPAIVLQLALELAVVAVLFIALPRLSGFSLRELGFTAPKPWQVGIALLGAVGMVVFVEGGAQLIQTLTHQKHEQAVVEMFKQITGQPALMWFFAVFAIVLAPFLEESIFRIFFFNLGMRIGGFWFGSISTGLFFGAAHITDKHDLVTPGCLAIGGVILASVYYRSRNAFCSMITHGCFNALTVFAIMFAPQLAQ